MVRDIGDRLRMFGVHDLIVKKVALTTDQVRQYNPPPNPAKMKDPRSPDYVAKHGRSSWEVDALAPPILEALINEAVEGVIDEVAWGEAVESEAADRARLVTRLEKVKP